MNDLISRQAALDIFDDYNVAVESGQIEAYSRDRKRLCDLPPAQPKQRPGKWLMNDHIGTFKIFTCDKCGWNSEAPFNFCPNCGDKKEIDVE